MTICFSPFSPVPSPISSRPWSMSSSSSVVQVEPLGVEAEDAHALEHEADAAGGAHVAAVALEVHAHVGHRAHDVVGGGLDEDRDAVRARSPRRGRRRSSAASWPLARLIAASTLSLGMLAARAFCSARRSAGLLSGFGPAGLHRDGDVLADAREQLRHLVPAGEHRRLAGLEDASHSGPPCTTASRGMEVCPLLGGFLNALSELTVLTAKSRLEDFSRFESVFRRHD